MGWHRNICPPAAELPQSLAIIPSLPFYLTEMMLHMSQIINDNISDGHWFAGTDHARYLKTICWHFIDNVSEMYIVRLP